MQNPQLLFTSVFSLQHHQWLVKTSFAYPRLLIHGYPASNLQPIYFLQSEQAMYTSVRLIAILVVAASTICPSFSTPIVWVV